MFYYIYYFYKYYNYFYYFYYFYIFYEGYKLTHNIYSNVNHILYGKEKIESIEMYEIEQLNDWNIIN